MAGNVKEQADKIAAMAKRPARENPFSVTEGQSAETSKPQSPKAPKGDNVRLSVYLAPDVTAALDDAWIAARRSGERVTRSGMIQRLLRDALGLER